MRRKASLCWVMLLPVLKKMTLTKLDFDCPAQTLFGFTYFFVRLFALGDADFIHMPRLARCALLTAPREYSPVQRF